MTHPVTVAADVDDVAVMKEPVDERGGHDFVAEDVAPLLEALVRRQYGRDAFVAPVDELEEEHGAGLSDGQIADLVDNEERGIGQRLETVHELARGLGLFERGDEIGERTVVDSAPALCGLDGEADREMCLTDAGGGRGRSRSPCAPRSRARGVSRSVRA